MRGKKNSKKNLKLRVGDRVIVVVGKKESENGDKGKIGEITKILPSVGRVIVSGVNLRTKHKKKDPNTGEGGLVKVEMPMNISNVMYYCESIQGGSRVGYRMKNQDGVERKVRYCKKTNEDIEEKKK